MAETVLGALMRIQANTSFHAPIPSTVEWRAIRVVREDNGFRFLLRSLLDGLTPGREDSIQELYKQLQATSTWKTTMAELRARAAQLQAYLQLPSPSGLALANIMASLCQLRRQLPESGAQDQAAVVARLLSLTLRLLLRTRISALLDAEAFNPTALVGGRLFVEHLINHSEDFGTPSEECEWSRCTRCNKFAVYCRVPVVIGIADNCCVGCTLEVYGSLEEIFKNMPGWDARIEQVFTLFEGPADDNVIEQCLKGFSLSGN